MCTTLFKRLADDFDNIVAVKLERRRSFEKAQQMRDMAPDIALFGGMAAVNMYEELEIGVVGNVPDAFLTDVPVYVYDNFVAGNVEQAQKTLTSFAASVTLRPESFRAVSGGKPV